MSTATPVRRSFRTRDPETATAAVQEALGGGSFTGVQDEMAFAQTATAYRGFVDGRMFVDAHAGAYLADGYASAFLMILRSGGMQVRQGGPHQETIVLSPGDAMLMAPEITTFAELDSPDIDFIQFGETDLPTAAAEAFPDTGSLDLRPARPRSPAARHLLVHAAQSVRTILASDDLSARPLLLHSALRHLAVVTLDAFDVGLLVPDRTRGAATVRRAVAFVDQRLDEPLTVHDIAAAAGVSVRTLQAAFRAVRDETPQQYLQRSRLDVVRSALRQADPATSTVADIAHRWGFTSMGRFAAMYRAEFGENPRDTLTRR